MRLIAGLLLLALIASTRASSDSESSDSYSEEPKKTVRFTKLKPDADLLPVVKTKKHRHSSDYFSLSSHSSHSKHHRHSHHKSKSRKGVSRLSFFSAAPQSVFEQSNSYICSSGQRPPKIPGGPQKTGFTFSRSWQRGVDSARQKDRKKRPNSVDFGATAGSNGLIPKFATETSGIVKNPVDAGWWLVSFEAGKAESLNTFAFKSKHPVTVSVVDLFCRGDSFAVLDEGRLIAQSSRVRPDVKCRTVVTSPQIAFEDGRWSSVVFDLDAGKHTITLRTIDNPFEGGMAAIRFETARNEVESGGSSDEESGNSDISNSDSASTSSSDDDDKSPSRHYFSRKDICAGYNGFMVITAPISKSKAGKACKSINAQLAVIAGGTNPLPAAIKSVYGCLGANRMAWVDAIDNDGIADLVIKADKGGKTGGLTQPTGDHAVLCMKKSE